MVGARASRTAARGERLTQVALDRAVATCRTAVRRSIARQPDVAAGDVVLVAVSGGADSMTLAATVAWVAPRLGLRAAAVTVDHQLQEGSAGRAQAAVETCVGLGLAPVSIEAVTVGRDGGPEAAARNARSAAIDAAASRLGAAVVLLGHTLDDH